MIIERSDLCVLDEDGDCTEHTPCDTCGWCGVHTDDCEVYVAEQHEAAIDREACAADAEGDRRRDDDLTGGVLAAFQAEALS